MLLCNHDRPDAAPAIDTASSTLADVINFLSPEDAMPKLKLDVNQIP